MRILALPRDPNPYQESLYARMRSRGVRISYAGGLTPSRTLNLMLLPLELAARRATGWRTLHVHWVFGFALPGAGRLRPLARLSRAWFGACLRVAGHLGMTIVWTAHNTLPHEPVFDDDVAARRTLVRASDLVIAHSAATLGALAAMGAEPARAVVVPIGRSRADDAPAPPPRTPDGGTRLLFAGQVLAYKGVEDLLDALADVPDDLDVSLEVVGRCPDPALHNRLSALAASSPHPVRLTLTRVDDARLAALLEGADVVVLPFRRVTTSSSAVLALDHGRPLIVPDLPGLRDLPEDAVLRYGDDGLAAAITVFARSDAEERDAMCAAARAHTPPSWDEIAERTIAAIDAARRARTPGTVTVGSGAAR